MKHVRYLANKPDTAYWMILVILSLATGFYLVSFANLVKGEQDVLSQNAARGIYSTASELADTAVIQTNFGGIELKLFKRKAPNTVRNFVALARRGFYDGTRFHRVIKGFIIQGGDPLSADLGEKENWGGGGPGYVFDDEISDQEVARGVIAMANRGPNTNGSQFFILTASRAPWLRGKHTIFGIVTKGMSVVDAIEQLPTDSDDRPIEEAIVRSIEIVE